MKISFESLEIRDLCRDNSHAVSSLGAKAASKLQNRLADMFSAKSPLDLIAGNPTILRKNSVSYRVDLDEGWVLVFSANNLQSPRSSDGSIEWSLVSRIKIDQITTDL